MKNKMKKLGLAGLVLSSFLVTPAQSEPVKAVVELFTSQGCSSCPPADKVLGELGKDADVLALAWHVDYWDYIGWKDTFASSAYTNRQRAYARAQNERMIYTPQAMINGRVHMNGGAKGQIQKTIDAFEGDPDTALNIPVRLDLKNDMVRLTLGEMPNASKGHYAMSLVRFETEVTVDIKRGENTGRELTYHNIVRHVHPMARWEGSAMDMALPDDLTKGLGEGMQLAVIIQSIDNDGDPGPIVGAAKLSK